MYQVTKRDGEITEFNLTKISEAIRKAFEAREKEYNQDIIDLLALKVTADFEPKIKEHKIAVEDIQDSVESVLIKAGYADVAKGYILYRKQREKIRNLNSTLLDYKENCRQLCEGDRLACQGEFYRDIFCRRSDLKQLRCDHSQLLAVRNLR